MKTFTTLLNTEKNKKTGASPVWILKIPFAAGTVYLSDRVFTITGWMSPDPTIFPWIAAWGQIDEDIAGSLTLPMVSDFEVNINIDPDAATDIHTLLWGGTPETLKCELYLWFEGLDASIDPPVNFWTGNIIDFERISEVLYNVRLVDESLRIDKYPGRVLSLADYPNASLDDVGYQMVIGYGTSEKTPALRLDVGKKTSLIDAITATATDFYLTDGTGFANGSDILIDGEQIHITTISTNHITACTRGYNSTTAAIHSRGALVLEKKTTCVFLYRDHPVKSIGNIYALREDGVPVDVTSLCTKYTGQGGANDLSGYAGMAVITCPGYITFNLAVSLGLVDGIAYTADTDGESIEERLCTGFPLTISEGAAPSGSYASMPSGTVLRRWYEVGWHGSITTPPIGDITIAILGVSVCILTAAGVLNELCSSPILINCPGGWPGGSLGPSKTGSSGDWDITFDYVKMCQSKDISTALTKTGTVTLTGADVAVGDILLISGEGYKDDVSGTFTGTPSALIERPDHIFKHFLYTQAAWPVADFSTDAATPFAADSYKFSMVINERKRIKEWLTYMALQCRCWFRFAGGKAYLLYRTDSLVSDKTITAAMSGMNTDYTTTVRIIRSPLDEILNVIYLYYQRDWTQPIGREAYQAVTKASDSTSITAYGEKEMAYTFLFDFVRDATMAADLRDFYLARYKDRKKVVTATVFLDNCEIEFADAVTFAALGNLLCEVRKVGLAPGNARTNDKIILTAREY